MFTKYMPRTKFELKRSYFDFRQWAVKTLKSSLKGTGLVMSPTMRVMFHGHELLGVEIIEGVGEFSSAFTFDLDMWNHSWADMFAGAVAENQVAMVPGYLEFIIENITIVASESNGSPGSLVTRAFAEFGLDFGKSTDVDTQWREYYKASMSGHTLEILDKNGVLIEEGMTVIGRRGMPKGDYLPKGFPSEIRVLLKVEWDRIEGGYKLVETGYHPEDEQFGRTRDYRQYRYQLKVDNMLNPESGVGMGGVYSPSMICSLLEIYMPGDITEALPEYHVKVGDLVAHEKELETAGIVTELDADYDLGGVTTCRVVWGATTMEAALNTPREEQDIQWTNKLVLA